MILSDRWQFVYIGPPKTASTSLHRWLSQLGLADDRWDSRHAGQHSIRIPPRAVGYYTFASVRQPVDRCVSLWAHSQYRWTHPAAGRPEPDTWPMSLREFVFDYQPTAGWFYRASLSQFLGAIRLDAVIRCEDLESDLLRLRPIRRAVAAGARLEPLPRLNPAPHPDRPDICAPEIAEAIEARWAADLDLPAKAPGRATGS